MTIFTCMSINNKPELTTHPALGFLHTTPAIMSSTIDASLSPLKPVYPPPDPSAKRNEPAHLQKLIDALNLQPHIEGMYINLTAAPHSPSNNPAKTPTNTTQPSKRRLLCRNRSRHPPRPKPLPQRRLCTIPRQRQRANNLLHIHGRRKRRPEPPTHLIRQSRARVEATAAKHRRRERC